MASNAARRLAILRARIFGDVVRSTSKRYEIKLTNPPRPCVHESLSTVI